MGSTGLLDSKLLKFCLTCPTSSTVGTMGTNTTVGKQRLESMTNDRKRVQKFKLEDTRNLGNDSHRNANLISSLPLSQLISMINF